VAKLAIVSPKNSAPPADILDEVWVQTPPPAARLVGACRTCQSVEPLEATGRCEVCDFLLSGARTPALTRQRRRTVF